MMRKTKKQLIILGLIAVLLVVGCGGHYFFTLLLKQIKGHDFASQEATLTDLYTDQGRIEPAVPGFVGAVGGAMPAVVHIAAKRSPKVIERYESTSPLAEFFRKFFGRGFRPTPIEYQSPSSSATGSGVIISGDGYVVTNNHVGVQVKALKGGKWQQTGIKQDLIIRAIDKQPVESLDQLANVLRSKKGSMLVEGIYPNGARSDYTLRWDDA